jgi:hypothetical protein
MQPDDSTQSLVEARALLSDGNGNPTPQYQAYLSYQNEYNDKLSAYNAAYERAKSSPLMFQRWPIAGKEYSDAVNDAMNKWIVLGHKYDIENALSLLKAHAR